jgi:hypothetical protein
MTYLRNLAVTSRRHNNAMNDTNTMPNFLWTHSSNNATYNSSKIKKYWNFFNFFLSFYFTGCLHPTDMAPNPASTTTSSVCRRHGQACASELSRIFSIPRISNVLTTTFQPTMTL